MTVAREKAARASGRQVWLLLWRASPALAVLVIAWALLSAVATPAVVAALGAVVGHVPPAIEHGMGSPAGHSLVRWLGIAALAYAVSLITDPIGAALGTACNARVTGDIQERMLAAVSGPPGVAHLEDADVLDRLARAEGSLTGFFPGQTPVTWVGLLSTRLAGVIGCAIVASYQWWLGLLLLAMWVLVRRTMLAALIRQATDLRTQSTTMRRAWYFLGVGSSARSAKELRVFGLRDFMADRFSDTYGESIRHSTEGLRTIHRRAIVCWLVVVATYALALTVVAIDAKNHTIDLRSLATLVPMLTVTMSAGSVTFDDLTLAWTLSALPDVDSLEADLLGGARPLASGRHPAPDVPREAIRFEGVHFGYPGGAGEVLTGVDLELPVGTSTALVGINGAGKSTLVSLVARLRDPTAGRIVADGVDLRELEPGDWQRRIALMTQEPVQYPFSAYDNVALGAIEHADDRAGVLAAAERAGFTDVIADLPDGWDTVLSRDLPGGVDLSGGQWQRLALARALFATRHGARLLILDEPTAALDVRSEAQFYQRFLTITEGLTTLLISHRFATVRRADRIAVLDRGRIAELGTHDELVALDGEYAQAYRLQAARFGGPA